VVALPPDHEGAPAAHASPVRSIRARLGLWNELTKPGITRLVLLTTAVGFYLASRGAAELFVLLHTLVGTGLAAGGSSALNQYSERDVDARMHRTAGRPLPSGRMRPEEALAFGLTTSTAGVLYLLLLVNVATALVVAATIVSYVLVYTPLKRRTPFSTVIGAVPGALPIVAGWTAGGGAMDAGAAALFGIMFLWQLPHFLALAWIYREDYRRGGLAMLTVFDADGAMTGRQAMLYAMALLPVSLVPTLVGVAGGAYFLGALLLGVTFLAMGVALMLRRSEPRARRLFLTSIVYLPVLLALMAADKLPR
jgi:heme o synthase